MGENPWGEIETVALTEGDNQRLYRLRQGMSDVEQKIQSGELNPLEGQALVANIQKGLGPLLARKKEAEARMKQAQFTDFAQQSAQANVVAAQGQEFAAQALPKRISSLPNPNTGQMEHFVQDRNGVPQPIFQGQEGAGQTQMAGNFRTARTWASQVVPRPPADATAADWQAYRQEIDRVTMGYLQMMPQGSPSPQQAGPMRLGRLPDGSTGYGYVTPEQGGRPQAVDAMNQPIAPGQENVPPGAQPGQQDLMNMPIDQVPRQQLMALLAEHTAQMPPAERRAFLQQVARVRPDIAQSGTGNVQDITAQYGQPGSTNLPSPRPQQPAQAGGQGGLPYLNRQPQQRQPTTQDLRGYARDARSQLRAEGVENPTQAQVQARAQELMETVQQLGSGDSDTDFNVDNVMATLEASRLMPPGFVPSNNPDVQQARRLTNSVPSGNYRGEWTTNARSEFNTVQNQMRSNGDHRAAAVVGMAARLLAHYGTEAQMPPSVRQQYLDLRRRMRERAAELAGPAAQQGGQQGERLTPVNENALPQPATQTDLAPARPGIDVGFFPESGEDPFAQLFRNLRR